MFFKLIPQISAIGESPGKIFFYVSLFQCAPVLIVRAMRLRRMKWVGHVARRPYVGEERFIQAFGGAT
jgi:hypothetical protein